MTDTEIRLIAYQAIKSAAEEWGMCVKASEFRGFVEGTINNAESLISSKEQKGVVPHDNKQ